MSTSCNAAVVPSANTPTATEARPQGISTPLTLLFAASVGVIIINLSAAQPLVGPIAASIGLDPAAGGLVAMAPLLGYAAGLFLLIPLADLVENRALAVRMLACAAVASAAAVAATGMWALLAALFVLGAASSVIQVLVPIAAAMAPPEHRGRTIGNVMSGLMVGILLSRPSAGLIADSFGWRAFYVANAVLLGALALVLPLWLPRRRPSTGTPYPALIASMWWLLCNEPVLRLRSLTAALMMAAFSLFWTAVAFRLSQAPFGLDQGGIAMFALVGAGGAFATPLAGRLGDRGWARSTTIASHVLVVLSFSLAAFADSVGDMQELALCLLALAAVGLDVGAVGDQTLGRRAINLLDPAARGRLNGLFVGLFFLGGSLGSAVAGVAWTHGGWPAICLTGAGFALIALIVHIRSAAGSSGRAC
ncbi:putative MFS family arabinose efflux permease [Azospirillum lipoferum]|uniref:MFS transporter n=1 Tax=Azospirillum TaxID=191 RepID=UPI001B3BF640|nr:MULTISPECIES: MFS transporter [Azospirillum]MCP1610085.1 putative MFS family arabinose efflux permease [Azospirillum lipoferum]MDW5534422.1 MFS transporter [Azospirillum sp. NL1]